MSAAAAVAPATACDWEEADGLRPPWACEETALATVTEICEHEHVLRARACAHHAVEVQLDGPGTCGWCAEGPAGHDCPALTVIDWDDPTAPQTIVREPADSGEEPGDDA